MTIQPNDRKHEQTPEFQEEAQQRADRTSGTSGRRRDNPTAQKDTPIQKDDMARKDPLNKDPLNKDTVQRDNDTARKDAGAGRDAVTGQDRTGQDRTGQDSLGKNHTSGQNDTAFQNDTARKGDAAAKDVDQRTDSVANQDRAKIEHGQHDSGAKHASDNLKPGAAENQAPVAARTRLFEEQEVSRFREQWRELQAGFVDEPRSAVREADTLVTQMMDTLTSQLTAQKRALQGESDAVDTEQLRVALQRYRSLFDQMLQV